MYAFTQHRPATVRQAASLLAKQEEAKLLAGGHTLIPTMKLRLAGPKHLVDLSKVEGLTGIEMTGRSLVIGAMTPHVEVATSPVVRENIPALAELAGKIGDPAVRHCGTLGGSVANNDPNADYPAGVLGLGATVITNKRRIHADEFFKGLFETALEPDEIITKVQFPKVNKAGYAEVPQSGLAVSRWSACSCRSAAPRSAWRSPARVPAACSASPRSRRRSRSDSVRNRWKG